MIDGRHDGTRHGHSLDAKSVAVCHVVLPHLGTVIDVLFHLYRRKTGFPDDVDLV